MFNEFETGMFALLIILGIATSKVVAVIAVAILTEMAIRILANHRFSQWLNRWLLGQKK